MRGGTHGCVLSPDLVFSITCSPVSSKRPKLPPCTQLCLKKPWEVTQPSPLGPAPGDTQGHRGCSAHLKPAGSSGGGPDSPQQLASHGAQTAFVSAPWPCKAGGKMEGQGDGPCGGLGWKPPAPPVPSPHLGLSRGLGGRRALACSPPSPLRTTPPILSWAGGGLCSVGGEWVPGPHRLPGRKRPWGWPP